MKNRTQLTKIILLLGVLLTLGAAQAQAGGQMIGINVLLNQPVTDSILQDLGRHGKVLDVISQINAVTLRARSSELSTIQTLSYVTGANADTEGYAESDFSAGTNLYNLDAVNVTDFGTTPPRVVGYDGEGVYIGVIDSGLPFNWRDYFPEERMAVEFARSFGGGLGEKGTVSSQPVKWERDTFGHGIAVTSVILGFSYNLSDPPLPATFNGVAPKATVIPVKVFGENNTYSYSALTRALLYLTDLKIDGSLGNSPLVINHSGGGSSDDVLLQAAVDYAIAHGVVVVMAAGNEADAGMRFPARYAPVISAGATFWVGQFPPDDPTGIEWILNDVSEGDPSQLGPVIFSAWELPGQDLDVLAPGAAVPAAGPLGGGGIGQVDYCFVNGTSFASPHVAGIAALMLQKNPGLTAAQIEEILENTAFPLPPDCYNVRISVPGHGHWWSWRWADFANVSFIDFFACSDASQVGHGLVQADAALAATPLP